QWLDDFEADGVRPDSETGLGLPTKPPEPDVRLGDAFWRAFLKTWDKPRHDPNLMATTEPWPGYWEQFHSFVETDVRQAAFDGKLPIWGRKMGNWVLEQTQRPV